MTIVFATNDGSDFPGAGVSTNAAHFRAAYVSRSFITDSNNTASTITAITTIPPVAGDITWIHFQYRKERDFSGNSSDGFAVMELYSGSGTKILDFDLNNGLVRLRLFGSSTLTINIIGNMVGTNVYSVDIKIDLTSDISVKMYINGGLVYDRSQAWSSSPGNPALIFWSIFQVSDFGGTAQYVSELIIADEPTIHMGISELTPNATGNYSEWLGDHAATGDNDLGTGASSKVVADKLSSVLTSFSGPASPAIRAVLVNTKASTRGGTVNDLRNFLRISATDYNGAAMGVGEGIENHVTMWNTNPDTTDDWNTADFAGTELGVESLA